MIAAKYALFAGISTLLNLAAQYLSFWLYAGAGNLYVAMFCGTLAGLLSKYILDKKFIFYHTPTSKMDDTRKFVMYSLMGVFTTIPFFATEMFFDYFFSHEGAKYLGAVIGLTIGYASKYFLDKKFVFREN